MTGSLFFVDRKEASLVIYLAYTILSSSRGSNAPVKITTINSVFRSFLGMKQIPFSSLTIQRENYFAESGNRSLLRFRFYFTETLNQGGVSRRFKKIIGPEKSEMLHFLLRFFCFLFAPEQFDRTLFVPEYGLRVSIKETLFGILVCLMPLDFTTLPPLNFHCHHQFTLSKMGSFGPLVTRCHFTAISLVLTTYTSFCTTWTDCYQE